MLYESDYLEEQAALHTAEKMCAAARTAPKAHGKDTMHTLVLTGDEKEQLAKKMEEFGIREMGDKMNTWYSRDAANIRRAHAVVLIGAEQTYRGVPHCDYCGFDNCGNCKNAGGNCTFAYIDLGIAVSSAAMAAAMDTVDTRIMFSVGKAAAEMGYAENACGLAFRSRSPARASFSTAGFFTTDRRHHGNAAIQKYLLLHESPPERKYALRYL